MSSLIQPARALVDPTHGVFAAVAARHWVLPFLILMFAVTFSGVAFALRWDAGPETIRALASEGELQRTTEKDLEDKIRTAGRVKLVGGAAKGVFLIPILVLLGTVAVKVSGWLIGKPVKFVSALSALSIALLPIAVFHLAYSVVALSSVQLSSSQADKLLPSHLGHVLSDLSPQMARLASVADFFNVWAAVLLGLGLSEAASVSRFKGVLWGVALYLAYAGVFLIGLPGMSGGGR